MDNGRVLLNVKAGLKMTVAMSAIAMPAGVATAQTFNGNDAPQQAISRSATSDDGQPDGTGDILVTGTRISGSEPPSPVYELGAEEIRKSGQGNLGEAIRSLPMNFSGGQNPGVIQGTTGGVNRNQTNGSSANLRGIGPDATLTLINGHRLAYDGFSQAVDISSIPLAAVESVQVVPDGSSAIYGSDAVAGVVNVLLKSSFKGLETSARVGIPTEGGGLEQYYDATIGKSWGTGGIVISGAYQHQNPITSTQRDYTQYMNRPTDLLGRNRQYNGVLTLHQDFGERITFSMDGLYSDRKSVLRYSPTGDGYLYDSRPRTRSFVIAPTISVRLPASWNLSLAGTIGEDRDGGRGIVNGTTTEIASGIVTSSSSCDCNRAKGAEINLDGPLFHLGRGDARIALGGGYRENSYFSIVYASNSRIGGSRNSFYGFGELNLPIVTDANSGPGLAGLKISAAGRYESYNDVGDIWTPKFGFIYSPVAGLEFKATWGRSFKAPTLEQQFQRSIIVLYPAAILGGGAFPTGSTAIYTAGGNRDLKPERSENWSATIEAHPTAVPGLRISASYFSIRYTDRVINPVAPSVALSNPIYSDFVTLNPDAGLQAAVIAAGSQFINVVGTYDPTKVVAIASNAYTNAARQQIQGVDFAPTYTFDWAGGKATLSGLASWLKSRQKGSSTGPWVELAGTVEDPPHFRARVGASWDGKAFYGGAYLNYIGGVKDDRSATVYPGDSMTTVDFAIGSRIRTGLQERRDLDILLAVQNLTNERPPNLRALDSYYPSFDSTNYSPIGRVVSLTIRNHW